MTALSVRGLCKAFGGVQAVRDVRFDVAAGELVALIGPNGAGKTTCFNLLGGQLRPDAGAITLDGVDLAGLPPRRIARLGVGRTFQITATFASMTVRENVQAVLQAHQRRFFGLWRPAAGLGADEAVALLDRLGMADQAERSCGVLAYGDLKRVELAMALAGRPRLLLMDEPIAGMAPDERAELMALTARLAHEDGLAVLFTEHDMEAVFGHADRVIVLNRGRILANAPPAAVRNDPDVQAVYLGEDRLRPAARPRLQSAALPPPDGELALRVDGLNAWYDRAHIVTDLALTVRRGEVLGLLGRNGAGKTTTLRAIMGLVPTARGRVAFAGRDILGLAPHRIARLGLGYVPEDRRIFTDLTVIENLEVGRQPPRPGAPAWTPERLFTLFPNLGAMRNRPAGRMSGGEQQMLTVARTLMGNPSLLLLDEPSEGLAPLIVEQMAAAILALKTEGLTVILCEQNFVFAGAVSDRAVVIEKGRIRYEGTFAALAADTALRRNYLAV